MKPDNIHVVDPDEKKKETAPSKQRVGGISYPSGFAGIIEPDNTVLCAKCALDKYQSDYINEQYEDIGVFRATGEADYPGVYCMDCEKPLSQYMIVYKNQDYGLDYDLWHLIQWSQQIGNMTIYENPEKAAKAAAIEAYELGFAEGHKDITTLAEVEHDPLKAEYSTDSAHYANNIAPELRALSGFIDSMGKGTYTEVMGISSEVFNEDISPHFHSGFYDKVVTENEKYEGCEYC